LHLYSHMQGLTSALAQLQGLLREHSTSAGPPPPPPGAILRSARISSDAQGTSTHGAHPAAAQQGPAAVDAGHESSPGAGAEAAGDGPILWPSAAQVPALQERLRSEAGVTDPAQEASQSGSPTVRTTRSSSPLEQRLSAMGANNPAAARVAAFNAAMGSAAVLPLPTVLDGSEDGSGQGQHQEQGSGAATTTGRDTTPPSHVQEMTQQPQEEMRIDNKQEDKPQRMVQGAGGSGDHLRQLLPSAAPLARQDSLVLSLIEQGRTGAWDLSEVMGEQALTAGHPHQACFYTGAAQGAAFAGSLPLELLVTEMAGGGGKVGAGSRFGTSNTSALLPGRLSGGGNSPTVGGKVAGLPRLRARRMSQSEGPAGLSRLGSGRMRVQDDSGSPPTSAGGARRLAALRAAGGDGLGPSRNLGSSETQQHGGPGSAENTPRVRGSFRAPRTSGGEGVASPRAPALRSAGGSGGVQQAAEGLVGVEDEEAGALLLGQLVQVRGAVALQPYH
jgi:hypothetical protein